MAISKASIVHALANSVFEFPELPGRWEVPSFWGVRAHATPQTSHPFGNLIGVSTLTEANADAVIAQVQAFFAQRHHRVRIPRQSCHRFQVNPATDSIAKLPPIP